MYRTVVASFPSSAISQDLGSGLEYEERKPLALSDNFIETELNP